MGFWPLVGMLLRGETDHSRTCYRWWKYWIPNWIDGYKRGVLDTSSTTQREGGYVYKDYRPGAIVYHFTKLVIGINIKLCTFAHKNRSHVRYLLPHIEHEILMDTIGTRDDPDGLLVWVHCQVRYLNHVCTMFAYFHWVLFSFLWCY